jgi:hypothetical protein
LAFVALFLIADTPERRLGGGVARTDLVFQPDTPHLTPEKVSDLTALIGVTFL